MQNIVTYFINSAKQYPNHTAIIDGKRQISYAQLHHDVQRYAYQLQEMGLIKGDRVLVLVPMSMELYRVLLSLFYLGLIAVFPDEWAGVKRLEQCCQKVPCQAMIYTRKTGFIRLLSKEIRNIPINLKTHLVTHQKIDNPFEVTPNSTALITLTTGSTGTPKAANRTQQFLQEQYNALQETVQPDPMDIDLVSLPIVLLLNLGVGATSVIPAVSTNKLKTGNVGKLVQQMNQLSINRLTASPHVVKSIAHFFHQKRLKNNGVQRIFTGGGPVYPSDAKIMQDVFEKASIIIIYGSTEAEPISKIPIDGVIKDQSLDQGKGLLVGRPYHKISVAIIPIESGQVNVLESLPNGETGEIVVSGPNVLQSYFNSDDAFAQNKIMDGEICWHRTGDGGFLDDKGNLYLTGRIKNMIKTQAGWISPFVAEYLLSQIENVQHGTILQVNDTIVVYIQTTASAHYENIERSLKQVLPCFDQIQYIKKMPFDKRHHTKIDYERLINQFKS